jgi:hypothetical protein
MAKIQVIIGTDGRVQAFVDRTEANDFEAASRMLDRLVGAVKSEGVRFDAVGEIEQHNHDRDSGQGVLKFTGPVGK